MKLRFFIILIFSFFSYLAISQPVASFSASPKQGCNPLKVDFTNTSTGATAWLWSFGNGNQSTLKSPSAVYNNPGKYTVTLVATDAAGKSDTMVWKDLITVFKSPVADMVSNKQEICAGDPIAFTDKSVKGDGAITKWKWDFGEGGTSASTNPVYTYTTAGLFDVTLAIVDANGCQSTAKLTKYIKVNALPTVTFTADETAKCKAPLDVSFTSDAKGVNPLKYYWQFGDAGTSTDSDPQHTYNNGNVYSVSLTVTDAKGCARTVTQTNLIRIVPPTADFDADKRSICPNQKVHFQNKCTPMTGTGTWNWDFDNGTTSTDREPDVTFSNPGTYKIYLKYTWDGCTAEVTKPAFITVNPPPTGKMSPHDTAICREDGGSFFLGASGKNLSSIDWYDNDSFKQNLPVGQKQKISTAANNLHIIKAIGVSPKGCKAVIDSAKILVRGPVPDIGMIKEDGCLPRTVLAYNRSKDTIQKYSWMGPEGEDSDSSKLSFVLTRFGNSEVNLTVMDIHGCYGTTKAKVKGGIKINVDFSHDTNRVCRGSEYKILNHSDYRDPDTVRFRYFWHSGGDPGDTTIFEDRESTIFKMMDKPGKIDTLSIIANSYGCISYLPKKKEPKVLILGPEVNGTIKTFCPEDSIAGMNYSTYYTKTFWRFNDLSSGKTVDYYPLQLGRRLSQTGLLWLYAYNDTTGCQDSIKFPTKADPQQVHFTYAFDCKTQKITTKNAYNGLVDSLYLWEVNNTSTGNKRFYHQKDIATVLDTPGLYKIKLSVTNPKYTCNPPYQISLRVFAKVSGTSSAQVDRTSCYPINLTLKDALFDKWKSASWHVGSDLVLKDTQSTFGFAHNDNQEDLYIYLTKTDSNNCTSVDTFYYKIGGWKAFINTSQNDENCRRSVVTFYSIMYPKTGNNYSVKWDFGRRISYAERDTLQIYGWQKFPVSLTIKDDKGCQSKDIMYVDVQTSSPKAYFTSSNTKATCPPLDVSFTDSSNPGKYPIAKRYWTFGDGTFSEKTNPGKLYIYSGKYSVSLIVINTQGCADTFVIPDLVVVDGPKGTYSFDKKFGCTPLQVNLNTTTSGKIKKFEFDMGDGNVLDKGDDAHTYKRPGEYIPRLILTDSTGCRFSPPPNDTIRVYPNPTADFKNGMACDNATFEIANLSDMAGEQKQGVQWRIGGKKMCTKDTFDWFPGKNGIQNVELWVMTSHGCADSVTKPFYVFGITPKLSIQSSEICLGSKVIIKDISGADTGIVQRNLWIDNKPVTVTDPVIYYANRRGLVPVFFVVQDAMGCKDTLNDNAFMKVGDTLPPAPLTMYRSTVLDDYTTESRFNSSREVDFKQYNLYCWLNGGWKLSATSSTKQDTNLAITGLNTLANSYCHRVLQSNFCDKVSDSLVVIQQCTIETKALGDTNRADVWWSPYGGWNEIQRYRIYRKRAQDANFALLDSVAGNTLKYRDTSVFCHVVYDYLIEGVEKGGHGQVSFSDTARAVPLHYLPIPAPEIWRTTVEQNAYTLSEWKMVKKTKFPVDYYTLYRKSELGWDVLQDNIQGSGLLTLNDKKTNVQQQNYTYCVRATDVCQTVSTLSNVGRSILLQVSVDKVSMEPKVFWTPYIYWNEGVQEYVVERMGKDGAFFEIGRTPGKDSAFIDKNIPLHCDKDFIYRVTAIRNQPDNYPDSTHNVISVSNWTQFLPEMKFFIPNAFTPDANGRNDKFHPDGVYFYKYSMKIYNRYGQKLYDNDECMNAWDGIYNGKQAPDGVYAYAIEVWDLAGKKYDFAGTLHLLR